MAARFIDVKAVAELIGTPASWVYEAAERREIPSFKIGRYVRFAPADVEAWIERQRRGPSVRSKADIERRSMDGDAHP